MGSVLHADLASFTLGSAEVFVFVGVESVSGYLFTRLLPRKSSEELLLTMDQIAGFLSSKDLKLSRLHVDSEVNWVATAPALLAKGITMTNVPPGQHERRSERWIRTLKATLRVIGLAFPRGIPTRLFRFALSFATRMINERPNVLSGDVSPRVLIDPHAIVSSRSFPLVGFGARCLGFFRPKNNMTVPTRPVIFLGYANGDGHSGFRVLDLTTKNVVTVHKMQWDVLVEMRVSPSMAMMSWLASS